MDDDVGFVLDEVAADDPLLDGVGRQAVGAGQVHDLDVVASVPEIADLLFNSDTRPVSDLLPGARHAVEDGGLPRVGVAREGYRQRSLVRHALPSPSLLPRRLPRPPWACFRQKGGGVTCSTMISFASCSLSVTCVPPMQYSMGSPNGACLMTRTRAPLVKPMSMSLIRNAPSPSTSTTIAALPGTKVESETLGLAVIARTPASIEVGPVLHVTLAGEGAAGARRRFGRVVGARDRPPHDPDEGGDGYDENDREHRLLHVLPVLLIPRGLVLVAGARASSIRAPGTVARASTLIVGTLAVQELDEPRSCVLREPVLQSARLGVGRLRVHSKYHV